MTATAICFLKEAQIKEWEPHVEQQLGATADYEELAGHRDLVSQRWTSLRAFLSADHSPQKLSPQSKELKNEIFKKDGVLSESFFKSYKKRMASYVQGLTNASERLNDVQREEACEEDTGDSTLLVDFFSFRYFEL